jgi:transglutaminase/protease-like cytokinesis protein 3
MRKPICILLAVVFLVSGCSISQTDETSVKPSDLTVASSEAAESTTTTTTTATTTTETTPEPTKAPDPVKFNPHVRSEILSKEYAKDEYWEAFYNCVDAIREGKDTFECKNKKAYEFATGEITFGALFPPACTLVIGNGFKDGVGKLKYKMDKDKFLEREQNFEKEIERMLNESVRSDYTDFEKIMGIFEFVENNFEYDYSDIDGNTIEEFGTYACLMTKKGICTEFASSYAYLLLQVGVDALEVGEFSQLYHAWTYVVCEGKGYYVDSTWGTTNFGEYDLFLTYFMQNDKERTNDGCDVANSYLPLVNWYNRDYDRTKYRVKDDRFKPLHEYVMYRGMDTSKKIIKYQFNDEERELYYGG